MAADFNTIQIEESVERLKIVWPVQRNWFLFTLFSLTLVIWLVMQIGMIVYLFRDVIFEGERFTFVFSVILFTWIYIWFRLGLILWKRWQYYAADREILFIDEKRLIIRRPVSILGLTEAYDKAHISPFYYADKHHCPAFDYGYQHVYFGHALAKNEAEMLVTTLNGRYFPNLDNEFGPRGEAV